MLAKKAFVSDILCKVGIPFALIPAITGNGARNIAVTFKRINRVIQCG